MDKIKKKIPWNKGLKGWNKKYKNSGFQKGHKQFYNTKGKKLSKKHIDKIRASLKGMLSGDKSPYWKGEKATYTTIHYWVGKNFKKPKVCIICGISNKNSNTEWSNIDHKYNRKKTDWIPLCKLCHWSYDIITGNKIYN